MAKAGCEERDRAGGGSHAVGGGMERLHKRRDSASTCRLAGFVDLNEAGIFAERAAIPVGNEGVVEIFLR